ncbi:restriction endonuclease subunit S [Bacteroides fragilis]|uniref:restriction endonuclease subunit S n=2 Tax=Bacteroidaceae TaxID=815 RepID=UPI001459F365|nr:restriction endonuclease subunit S [Bacteroides fragilis]NME73916.1 restriction endonuclease subunit S [Bacteroides fragilis]
MELKKYRLGEILELQRGYDLPSSQQKAGNVLVAGSNGIIGYHNEIRGNHPCITVGRSGSVGKVHYYEQPTWAHNTALFVKDFKGNNPQYLYYFLKNLHLDEMFVKGSSVVPSLDRKVVHSLVVPFHKEVVCQKRIALVLSNIDRKIELNRAINQNLEAMAKLLYDYWFVQFDFPNENGKPYKSSGGKMVWNKKIKREIPEGWKEVTLNAFIDKNKAGDWGYDIPKDGTIKVGCVRGADIIKLNDVPTRYITSKHSDRLLEDGDIVIEISGGSPVQATGRVALITNGVIGRNGGALVCSNFCQSFNMKKREFSEYFYYLWQNLYDNGNMFNFEGKTSGIKNFQTDVFLANHWFEVPKQLIETFHTIVAQYHLMIDQNIIENNNLTKQRDELLPLLMNGQVSVNSDLSDD